MSKICSKCNTENHDAAKFCVDCGGTFIEEGHPDLEKVSNEKVEIVGPNNPSNDPSGISGISKVGKVFWIIFIGIWLVIEYFFLSIFYFITIVGIPLGKIYFKSLKLFFNPIGKRVITHYGDHPILNTFGLIFGGLETYLLLSIVGCLFFITIVGIPIARQIFKFATYFLAPFGAEIIEDGQFTKYRNTKYDKALFFQSVMENPYQLEYADGKKRDIYDYVKMQDNVLDNYKKQKENIESLQSKLKVFQFIFMIPFVFTFLYFMSPMRRVLNPVFLVGLGSVIFVVLVSIYHIYYNKLTNAKMAYNHSDFMFKDLYKYYPAPKKNPYSHKKEYKNNFKKYLSSEAIIEFVSSGIKPNTYE